MGSLAMDEKKGALRVSLITDDTLTKEQRIELIKDRIAWIDMHEKMFEISSLMHLERIMLREELAELEGE